MLKCALVGLLVSWSTLVVAKDWWEHAQLYQIYPRSYKDTDGDGIGDLKGIIQKLDHLKDAGVDGVWLSPIFASPMVDFGYDISNYREINPQYGTMDDFTELVQKCKALAIKLILDFVPNHSSDEHEWFEKSARRVEGYEDYYVWADGKKDEANSSNILPPSNWNSIFYGSAWSWNEDRKQFYLHQFAEKQPDLNYRSASLVQEMKDILKFWLDKGVDGFRVDAVPYLFESVVDGGYPDEARQIGSTNDTSDYEYFDHKYTKDLPETFDMITQWRATLDEYRAQNGGDVRLMMVEAYTTTDVLMNYFGTETKPGAHFPFNFNFITFVKKDSTAQDMVNAIHDFIDNMPTNNLVGANWVIGNHDQSRVTTRYGEKRVDGITMIIMLLPGVSVTYQGDEIAMTDKHLSWNETVDPQACNTNPGVYEQHTRDPGRTPFHWDSTKNAGFSTADKTWLPIADNYLTVNLQTEQQAAKSHYKTFQAISKLRREKTFEDGDLLAKALNPSVLGFKRSLNGYPTYIVVVNSSDQFKIVSLSPLGSDIPLLLSIVLTSIDAPHQVGNAVNSRMLVMGPYEALVLKTK